MSKIFSGVKNYKSSLILVIAVVIGGIVGLVMGTDAKIFAPLGDLFLNMIFMVLVPMVFFSIASSIANLGDSKKLGKILIVSVLVFLVTSIIVGILGIIAFKIFNPVRGIDSSLFINLMESKAGESQESASILSNIVSSISVDDFSKLLSRNNLLAVVISSIIVGIAAMQSKEAGKPFISFLNSGAAVCSKIINIIMIYAPVGLAAYFANVIGSLGGEILNGYFKIFILYTVLSLIYFFGFFTLYAYVARKKQGVIDFWKHSAEPTVTALATCSSAACIPVNIEAAKKMGVSDILASIVMPIGVNIHKDGSVLLSVFKIMFLFVIFGRPFESVGSLVGILVVAVFTGLVIAAIPIGGAIGEMLTLSIFGFPAEALAMILVIATIGDAPATLLNSTGNTVCTMIVDRLVGDKEHVMK